MSLKKDNKLRNAVIIYLILMAILIYLVYHNPLIK